MGLFKKRPPNTNNTYINFVIAQRGGDKKITDLRTRDFYNMLLGQIIKLLNTGGHKHFLHLTLHPSGRTLV